MNAPRGEEPAPDRFEPPGQAIPPLLPPPDGAGLGYADAGHPQGRRKRKWIFVLAGVVVLAGAAVAGWFFLQARVDEHNAAAPADAVEAYVDAIARGDASTANDLVDPTAFARDVDLDLLTDKMLGSADERITVLDITKGKQSGETVEVTVDFRIRAETFPNEVKDPDIENLPRKAVDDSVTLRAMRAETDLFGFETWRVLDPFLVPMSLMVGGAPVDEGTFGSESVSLHDLGIRREPPPVFVYPALYPLGGPDVSRHLEQHQGRQFLNRFDGKRPTGDSKPSTGMLIYTPTEELRDTVSARIAEHVKHCRTASTFPPNCPAALESSGGTTVRITRKPALDELLADPSKPYGKGKPMTFVFIAEGDVSLTNLAFPDGFDLPLLILGEATIATDDKLSIAFRADPGT